MHTCDVYKFAYVTNKHVISVSLALPKPLALKLPMHWYHFIRLGLQAVNTPVLSHVMAKTRPFQIMQTKPEFVSTFNNVGQFPSLDPAISRDISLSVSCMESLHTEMSTNFVAISSRPKVSLSRLRKPSLLMAAWISVCCLHVNRHSWCMHTMYRANYIVFIGRQSHVAFPYIVPPIGLGYSSAIRWNGTKTTSWHHAIESDRCPCLMHSWRRLDTQP